MLHGYHAEWAGNLNEQSITHRGQMCAYGNTPLSRRKGFWSKLAFSWSPIQQGLASVFGKITLAHSKEDAQLACLVQTVGPCSEFSFSPNVRSVKLFSSNNIYKIHHRLQVPATSEPEKPLSRMLVLAALLQHQLGASSDPWCRVLLYTVFLHNYRTL